jgi:hypothetical protein
MIPNDTSSYNTYLLDSNNTGFVAGEGDVPANGLMFYYGTDNFALIRQYVGIEVTIDVIIYTYRSNNRAFAIYYVGGADGITATLTDEDKLKIDAAAISVPASITEATTLPLPKTGSNGSTIAWTFTDSTNLSNSYVNLTDGKVTIPVDSQVTVSITATITIGTLDPEVRIFVLKIGVYPISTTIEAKSVATDTVVRVVGVITATTDDIAFGAYWLQDAAGAISLFDPTNILEPSIIGKTYDIVAPLTPFNGLLQLRISSLSQMVEVTGDQALSIPTPLDISSLTLNSTNLLPLQSQLVTLNGFILKIDLNATYTGSFSMNFVNSTGQEIVVRLDRDVPGFANFVSIVASAPAGSPFNFEGLILGWFNNPQLLVASTSKVTVGTAYTDQQLANAAAGRLGVPAANDKLEANLTLPVTGLFGTTVAWTSSNPDVISTSGVVTRPASGQPDANVTLSYVVSLGTASSIAVDINFTVKANVATGNQSTVVTASYIAGSGTKNMIAGGANNAELIGLNPSLFTVLSTKNSASVEVGLNNAGHMRLYNNATGLGTKLEIQVVSGYVITQVEIAFGASTNSAYAKVIYGTTETILTSPQSLNSNQIFTNTEGFTTFSVQNVVPTATSTQVFMNSIKITYQPIAVA